MGRPIIRRKRFFRRANLTHEDRRQIAKRIVAGVSSKNISAMLNVSETVICHIRKAYVIVTLSERYPDVPEQPDLPLPHTKQEPLGSP